MAQPYRVVIPDLVNLAAPTTGLTMYSVMEMKTVLRTVVMIPGELTTVVPQRLQKLFAEVIFNMASVMFINAGTLIYSG